MTSQSSPNFPAGAIIGIVVLALAGAGLLAFALFGGFADSTSRAATPTQLALVPTRLINIPTTTPVPTQPPPTATLPPTELPTAAPTLPSTTHNITLPANVRSGPGTNYPIIGGLPVGAAPTVTGRDASAQWFAISDASLPGGQGWVADLVANFSGDVNSLPVISAPPPPPLAATATAVPANTSAAPPPTSTPVLGSRGIIAEYFTLRSTSVAVNQDIWFDFKVVNTSDNDVPYGVLAAHTESGQSAQSWTNEVLKAHAALQWTDHLNLSAPGTYRVYLGICYGSKDACLANSAPWDRLSPSITVTVN
jgi:uncharacterized protein YraI